MSRKKQVFTIVISVSLLLLIVFLLYQTFKPEPAPEYQLAAVSRGNLQKTFETKGTVESAGTETFTAISGVKVLTVNTAVGSKVNAGDVLATFDVSTVQDVLQEQKAAYDKAKVVYDKASKTVSDAKTGLSTVHSEITQTEKDIAALQNEIDSAKSAQATKPSAGAQYTPEQIAALIEQLRTNGMTQAQIDAIIASVQSGTGELDIEEAISNSIAAKELQLAQKKAQLATLKTQSSVYEAQTDDTVTGLYKSVMDQKLADYEGLKAVYDALKAGWVASSAGIVTEVNVYAGQAFVPTASSSGSADISSIIGSLTDNSDIMATLTDILGTTGNSSSAVGTGIVLESYGAFTASFTVGKYDLLDLKVGQAAAVSSLGSDYSATVSYVGATASESTGLDISSITSSLTGGSSSSSASAVARVKISNPDEKIMIGFDVDVKINTEEISDVLKIPVDCVATDESETYVFVYNPSEKTVEKRAVTLGVFSNDDYEIVSGLSENEQVVMNPKTALTDGTKISVKAA